jgi:hypothetical protein
MYAHPPRAAYRLHVGLLPHRTPGQFRGEGALSHSHPSFSCHLDDHYFGWHHKDFTCASSREDGAGFPLLYFSLSQIPLGGNMKHAVIAHQIEARDVFEAFIKTLQAHLLDYYYSGVWTYEDRGSFPTQAFVGGAVDRILLHFAREYYCQNPFDKHRANFVLATARPSGAELVQLPYPLDEDLLGEHPGLNAFRGMRLAIFERLLYLYAVPAPEQIYASITTSIDNLINLVLSGIFVRMERGSLADEDPSVMPNYPATRICIARPVQDVKIDSRLVIGSDFVWIPVIPDRTHMRTAMDNILGYEEPEEKPIPPWEVTFEEMRIEDLSKAQQDDAFNRLNKGRIHSVYKERGAMHVIMELDLDHPYVWKPDGKGAGSWKRVSERIEYWKLMGSSK